TVGFPIPPCRSVCQAFVDECGDILRCRDLGHLLPNCTALFFEENTVFTPCHEDLATPEELEATGYYEHRCPEHMSPSDDPCTPFSPNCPYENWDYWEYWGTYFLFLFLFFFF